MTRDQYAAFVNATGYKGSGRCFTFEQNVPKERENRSFLMPGYAQDGNHPAVCVSWNDAQAYVDWLSKTTGKSYRLPSEAEYEYAARAGSTARFAFTDDPADLCRLPMAPTSRRRPRACRRMRPTWPAATATPSPRRSARWPANAFGLHDLIGNVWEWTADCFADDYTSATLRQRRAYGGQLPGANGAGRRLVLAHASSLRPAVRAKASPDAHHDDIGFRVVRTLAH